MNKIIKSIIMEGSVSPYLNDFINICIKISLAALRKNSYKQYVLSKSGLSEKDFAIDAIADLFKNIDGKYIYLENYFLEIIDSIDTLPNEIIQSRLNALLISRTNQRITEIREEFDEIYFKVKRAVNLHLSRQKGLKKIHYNGNLYFYVCGKEELVEEYPEISKELILNKLNSVHHKKLGVSNIVNIVIDFVDSQSDKLRAVSDTLLYQSISEFYKSRKRDYLHEVKNVHYNYNEDFDYESY